MASSPRIEVHELYGREFQVIMAKHNIRYYAEPLGKEGKAVVFIMGTVDQIDFARRIMLQLRSIIVSRWVRTPHAVDMMLAATAHDLRVTSLQRFLWFTRVSLKGDVSDVLSFTWTQH